MENIALFIKESNGHFSDQVKNAYHSFSKVGQLSLISVSIENPDQLVNTSIKISPEMDAATQNAQLLVFENNHFLTELAADLSVKLNCEIFTNVIEFTDNQVVCQAFSGKAKSVYQVNSADKYVLVLSKSFKVSANNQEASNIDSASIQKINLTLDASKGNVLNLKKNDAGISLVDAKFVVGAGRGMKDPSNWGIIEDLAKKLGAGLACSKPVSDINWRPHHEHVGQTGIKIAPKLYIACGISGAIQHLAGVNGSDVIVVINNDPEAPFVKNADYAIIGDLFQVVPELLNNIN